MKKILAIVLMLSLLTGCGKLIDNSYLVTEKHSEQPTEPTQIVSEEILPTVITNRSDLRGAVLSCIRDWVEHDILLVENYDGDLSGDLAEILHYATEEDPMGAYAVDFIDAQLTGDSVSGSIELSIVFRRSAAEIDSIITVNNTSNALRRIQQALTSYETALTLRIRNYDEEDFAAYIRDYCLQNLDLVLALPEFSAEVYPPSGETRILELHFTYPDTREEMRVMLSSTNTILTSAASYINSGEDDAERLALLTRFLTTRFRYQIAQTEPSMPAYDLLCKGLAHSLSFAAVFRYECVASDIDCWLVSGTRHEQKHYWNIVCIDEVYYHVDLMRGIEQNEYALTLLSAQELLSEGYLWDIEAYPSNPEPEPEVTEESWQDYPEPTESTEASPETTQETEPTEPTEETEESSAETEPTESDEP